MKQIKFKFTILMLLLGLAILFSGCIDEANADISTEQKSPTASNESIQVSKLENKIDSMQQQIDDLQNRIDRVDLLKPSEKQLIPRLPFKVEIYWGGEWQTPVTYTFKENGLAELGNGNDKEYATYQLFRNNNTIMFNSPKYEFYGLVFYDDYAASIYENGWMGWVYKYKIFPPKYNSIKQMYELN